MRGCVPRILCVLVLLVSLLASRAGCGAKVIPLVARPWSTHLHQSLHEAHHGLFHHDAVLVEMSSSLHKHRHRHGQRKHILQPSAPHGNDIMDAAHEWQMVAVSLYNFRNTQYVGFVGVGTPVQPIPVIFDTGSANLWIAADTCTSVGCQLQTTFQVERSSSLHPLGYDINVRFGTGEINGFLAEESLYLGGGVGHGCGDSTACQQGAVQVSAQTMAVITEEKGDVFHESRFSGILGLGFPSLSTFDLVPVMDHMMRDAGALLPVPAFSFYYGQAGGSSGRAFQCAGDSQDASEDELGAGSALFFGPPPDLGLYQPPIYWLPVSRCMYWETLLYGVRLRQDSGEVSTVASGCSLGQPCRIVFDTGTSLITGPSEDVKEVLSVIFGAAAVNPSEDTLLHMAPSSLDTASHMPSVQFLMPIVAGCDSCLKLRWFTLKPKDYLVLAEDEMDAHQKVECDSPMPYRVGLAPLDVPPPRGPLWILGDLFFRAFFSVYDRSGSLYQAAPLEHTASDYPTDDAQYVDQPGFDIAKHFFDPVADVPDRFRCQHIPRDRNAWSAEYVRSVPKVGLAVSVPNADGHVTGRDGS